MNGCVAFIPGAVITLEWVMIMLICGDYRIVGHGGVLLQQSCSARTGTEMSSQWTTTPPTEPGWYWWRTNEGCDDHQVVFVFRPIDTDRLLVATYMTAKDLAKPPQKHQGEWWPERIKEPVVGVQR